MESIKVPLATRHVPILQFSIRTSCCDHLLRLPVATTRFVLTDTIWPIGKFRPMCPLTPRAHVGEQCRRKFPARNNVVIDVTRAQRFDYNQALARISPGESRDRVKSGCVFWY
ncbi:MAG: hypothetical protein ABSA32_13250 [Candidatus Acidiferrales bacterium]